MPPPTAVPAPPSTTAPRGRWPGGRARIAVVIAAALFVGLVVVPRSTAQARPWQTNGWRTDAIVTGSSYARGGIVTVGVKVTSTTTRRGTVTASILGPGGRSRYVVWRSLAFTAGTTKALTFRWRISANEARGDHRVVVRVYRPGGPMQHANVRADTFWVRARFRTLPVGAALPSGAACAARVVGAREIRPANRDYNRRVGRIHPNATGLLRRVNGNFRGTTDEIIQWAACKWGFDEDVIRAQTAKESWWFQRNGGDFTTDPDRCAPGHGFGVDGRPGECAESVGVQQVRYPYHPLGFPWSNSSTAHNLDYALALRRSCFNGNDTWLNQFERGRDYRAGDLWGCVGLWFSGRWYTDPAVAYIAEVRSYLAQRIWRTRPFIDFTG